MYSQAEQHLLLLCMQQTRATAAAGTAALLACTKQKQQLCPNTNAL
jgi:hypothetical protein